MRQLTVELYPYEVAKLLIGVLQEDPVVPVGFKVEGDVSAGPRPEGGEGDVGGLGEGYGIPDVSLWKKLNCTSMNNKLSRASTTMQTTHHIQAHCRRGSGVAQR